MVGDEQACTEPDRLIDRRRIRIEIPIWTEGFDATLPKDYDTSAFEDPIVMSDATLWMARQDLTYTGNIVEIHELRAKGVVRPFTRASRG